MKYGKLAPITFDEVGTIDSYLSSPLATAPAEVKPPGIEQWPEIVPNVAPMSSVDWGMLGNGPDPTVTVKIPGFDPNEGCGDCTIAGDAHGDEAVTWDEAEHEAKNAIPSNDVVSTYFTLTKGVDSGLACGQVLLYGHTTGLFGKKNLGFGRLPGAFNEIDFGLLDQVIASFGLAYIGINCPESAEQQYANNAVWSVVPNSPLAGGHCIVLVGYLVHNGTKLYVAITWGQFVFIEEAFLRQYMDEAWAVLMPVIAERGEFKKVNLAALQADLKQIATSDATVPQVVTASKSFIDRIESGLEGLYHEVPTEVKGFIHGLHKASDAAMEHEAVEVIEQILADALKAYTHGLL